MAIVIDRRGLMAALGGAAAAWPLAARAQQPAAPVVGYLGLETPDLYASRLRAFHEGLGATGYEEGRNVKIVYRWAEGHNDRVPALLTDLINSQVAVIVVPGGVPGALAAKAATSTIPIVFEMGADPVALGLVASLNHPGGNITGATSLSAEVNPKRVELLHDVVPAATVFGLLVNPTSPANAQASIKLAKTAADALGLQLQVLDASTERDFDAAFAALVKLGGGGLVISNETFFVTRQEALAAASVRYAMPAIAHSREFTAAGGLMSYSGSFAETHRQAGVYTGRILKGEKPADLPVVRASQVELFINLKTAKKLGLTVPLSLLGRADEVIE
jgi:putative tryptophan/tyrosine transport system substrate-binding protein